MSFGNPEMLAMRNVDRQHKSSEYLHPVIIEAAKKARNILEKEAIDPKEFIYPYGSEEVARDVALVEKLRAKFETSDPHKKYADVMEVILYEHIEQSDWFGPNSLTIKPSLYDDYKNGVDLIVETEDEDRGLVQVGLAVDITFGTTSIQKKFDRIREEIKNGKLTEVKYFKSERSPHKGLYEKMPRVVIGTEREHVTELAALWLDPKRKKEFAAHPLQKVLLQEITTQLEEFRDYARVVHQPALVPIFERELRLMRDILASKDKIASRGYEDDRVFGAIRHQLELF